MHKNKEEEKDESNENSEIWMNFMHTINYNQNVPKKPNMYSLIITIKIKNDKNNKNDTNNDTNT